jgi:phosphomethylpyrimidine synthase
MLAGGAVTEEMQFVARAAPKARCDVIIPANIHDAKFEPMCLGVAWLCKINANTGNSATTSKIDDEFPNR